MEKKALQAVLQNIQRNQFKRMLAHTGELQPYKSDKHDRQYQFWKRDPLAVPISSEQIFLSKLDYIHNNPIKEKWSLSKLPEEYRWSSAQFYLNGYNEFNMLTHHKE